MVRSASFTSLNIYTIDIFSFAMFAIVLHYSQLRGSSMLDNDKFGPGNRPYWEMKEGRVSTLYPGLLRALSRIQDPEKHRLLFESHRRKMGSG